MASKLAEFVKEFPIEYRHAHPLFHTLLRVFSMVVATPTPPPTENNNNNRQPQQTKKTIKLLEMGSGYGEHAVYFTQLFQRGGCHALLTTEDSSDHFVDPMSEAATQVPEKWLVTESVAPTPVLPSSPSQQQQQQQQVELMWQTTEMNIDNQNRSSIDMEKLHGGETTATNGNNNPYAVLCMSHAKHMSNACAASLGFATGIPPPRALNISLLEEWDALTKSSTRTALTTSATAANAEDEQQQEQQQQQQQVFFDVIFSVNVFHIAPLSAVHQAFVGASRVLRRGGVLCCYGPYAVDGKQTSPSNEKFDAFLKAKSNGEMGIRDVTELSKFAASYGLSLTERIVMPENNFVMVWRKE